MMSYGAAVTVEAAGKQEKYWEMHDLIFGNQDMLDADFSLSLAEDLNLDLTQFAKDSKSQEIRNRIAMDFEAVFVAELMELLPSF